MNSALLYQQRLELLPCIAHRPEDLETLLDANSFRERLHKEINSAKTRIYLVALYLQDDEAGRAILDSLYHAKQKNPELDVKVLVDWHRAQRGLIGDKKSDGNAGLYREYAERFQHQIEILGVPVKNKEVFGVLHLKGFIIDGTVIYSGASLNDVYLAQKDRYRYDRYHVIKNPKLADSMANFITDLLVNSNAVNCLTQADRPLTKDLKPAIKELSATLSRAHYDFMADDIAEDQVGLTPMVGLGKRGNTLNNNIQYLIAGAQKEIIICTPYFNLPKSINKEVKHALKRGVKIDFIIGDKEANDFFISPDKPFKTIAGLPYLYEVYLRRFAKANEKAIQSSQLNIHLWKHDANSFHLKGVWVDRSYMLITGNNLNPRAWKLDLENAILLHDKNHLLEKQKLEEIDCIMTHTTRLNSYKKIADINTYPEPVQKLLKRIHRFRADALLKQIM
ncbi:CDP-diacylglycerol--serine O-phosphatidyltransferase [Vibrio sp. SS-MA-C1-2]|uniref:CDP-diacylglycerol--serine O-phosphatidyltransferase n=1 Tax=Vibrio sp. SS-MA-C1-2 TaxID=2908646 RepID=UPI001F31EF61|nr:CDP-diacylglycerol--serine O-phosphatidyltransferase [Vibrio sp. SS-MA-C1-2]UJF19077.1 CDP-diacylglycerol--serine O-phosphatidyltransferase [Vibrio sp. SS-MA-C1-2]